MLSHLCRIWQAWTTLGGNPFSIHIWDNDTVSKANLARQCFCEADLGLNKALVLAHRMQAFYGLPVTPHGKWYPLSKRWYDDAANLLIGCVDNLEARRGFAEKPNRYWLDLGNGNDSGQVILGGNELPNFFDIFPKMKESKDTKDAPSCSLAEALEKQDLFINSTLATLAGQLIWQLMRKGGLSHHGYFVNLRSGRVLPIEVPSK